MIRRRRNKKARTQGLSRRRFIQGLGGGALALPFLEYFSGPGSAFAADEAPKRLIVIAHHQGWVPDDLVPQIVNGELVLGEQLAALAPYKDKLSILTGIENTVRYVNNGAKVIGFHRAAPASSESQQHSGSIAGCVVPCVSPRK